MVIFSLFSALIINEVMSNPAGLESGAGSPGDRNEFIEIYNSGNDTVDISQYLIADRSVSDNIQAWDTTFPDPNAITGTTLIPPKFYGVIMDPEYIDSGDGTHLQPYRFSDSTIVLKIDDTTIGDGLSSKDTIYLISPAGDTIDFFAQGESSVDGVSYERVNPFLPGNTDNTKLCVDSSGSTPGKRNSVFMGNGIYISTLNLTDTLISVTLFNPGLDLTGDTIFIYDDYNRDGLKAEDELIYSEFVTLDGGDSLKVLRPATFDQGVHLVVAMTGYSRMQRYIRIGNKIGDLVINEIMAAPDLGCEWIELYNPNGFSLSVKGWMIQGRTLGDVALEPLSYLIVADDSTEFISVYGMPDAPLMSLSLSLANTGDTIDLMTQDSFVMDRTFYTETERGFSIEKINPLLPSDELTSWSTSVVAGGTPGRRNSVFTEGKENTDFYVYPRVFTPDGDGVDEILLACIPLPFLRNHVDVQIFNIRGKRIYREKFDSGEDMAYFRWDGKKIGGGQAEKGVYILYVEVSDVSNGRKVIYKKSIAVGRRY